MLADGAILVTSQNPRVNQVAHIHLCQTRGPRSTECQRTLNVTAYLTGERD